MALLKWEIAPTSELTNGFYAWIDHVTPDGVSGFEIALGSRGWGVALRGGGDNSWFIPAVDGLATMPDAAAAAEEIYALLLRLNEPQTVEQSHAETAPSWITVNVVRSDDGAFILEPDDAFWQLEAVSNNERFDAIPRGKGSLLVRACPYVDAGAYSAESQRPHADDPEFVEGSHCGLTKWTCAGCGKSTIVATEDEFPEGWLEVTARKPDGDTLAFEAVCARDCLTRFAISGAALRSRRPPGFTSKAQIRSDER